jgi:serine/threonine protein kinase
MAPECAHNKPTGLYSDIWSLGCIFYQLYCGILPFRGKSEYLIFLKSTIAEYGLPHESIFPLEAQDLFKSIIKIPHEERPTIKDLLSNPFFNDVRDLIEYPFDSSEEMMKKDEIIQDLISRYSVH